MPDEFDAPVEQATAAPGEKRHVTSRTFVCPHCGREFFYPEVAR
jgi:hypothetical protein